MSIINEALKKAQVKFELQTSSSQKTAEKKEKNVWLWATTAVISIGFAGCFFVFVFLIASRNQPSKTPLREKASDTLNQKIQTILSKTKTDKLPKNALILNGTIIMDNDQIALINNQIYRAGDYVSGKRILSVSQDKVEVFDKGNILILKTGNVLPLKPQ